MREGGGDNACLSLMGQRTILQNQNVGWLAEATPQPERRVNDQHYN